MFKFVVVLETTGPNGEPWEQYVSPRFSSEAGAAAWRKENKLPDHCRIRPVSSVADEAKELLTGPGQESLKQKWQGGDVQALLEAIQKYGVFQEPLPLWCWSAVHDAALKLSMYEARDLNEAFAFETKGRGRLKDRNKQAKLQWHVFIICEELRNKGRPVSPDMFDEAAETAGERFGADIGKTTAEKYYYAVKKELESLRPVLPASG